MAYKFDPSKVSKSTLIGILSFIIVEIVAWMTLPPKASIPVTLLAFCQAALHFLTVDADLLQPKTPGNPTQDAQPAHPVADDPSIGGEK